MKTINLTPHAICITKNQETINRIKENGFISEIDDIEKIESSGVARVSCKYEVAEVIDNISIYKSVYGDIVNLPDPQPDTRYIVSGMLLNRLKEESDRTDVFAPAELLRDSSGRPIATVGLIQ